MRTGPISDNLNAMCTGQLKNVFMLFVTLTHSMNIKMTSMAQNDVKLNMKTWKKLEKENEFSGMTCTSCLKKKSQFICHPTHAVRIGQSISLQTFQAMSSSSVIARTTRCSKRLKNSSPNRVSGLDVLLVTSLQRA